MEGENINEKIDHQTNLLEQILEQTEKTRKYLLRLKILGVLKVLLIATPIILAIIYLPPVVRKFIEDYKSFVPGLERIQEIIESSRETPESPKEGAESPQE